MKNLFCLFILLSSISTFADDKKAKGLSTNSDLNNVQTISDEMKSQVLEILADRLCLKLDMAKSMDKKPKDVFKEVIGNHLNLNSNSKNIRKDIIKFWNTNSNKLICRSKAEGYKSPQHVIMRVIDMRVQEDMFFDFLLESDDGDSVPKADVNIIHINQNGEKETILDYVESILLNKSNKGNYNFEELQDFKDSLEKEYDGKYFKYAEKYPGNAMY